MTESAKTTASTKTTRRKVDRVYRQLEGALRRLPEDRRRKLAAEMVEQADREDGSGESVTDDLRRMILESGRSVFGIAKAADVGYTKLRAFLRGTGVLRSDSIDKLARVLGARLVAAERVTDRTRTNGRAEQ